MTMTNVPTTTATNGGRKSSYLASPTSFEKNNLSFSGNFVQENDDEERRQKREKARSMMAQRGGKWQKYTYRPSPTSVAQYVNGQKQYKEQTQATDDEDDDISISISLSGSEAWEDSDNDDDCGNAYDSGDDELIDYGVDAKWELPTNYHDLLTSPLGDSIGHDSFGNLKTRYSPSYIKKKQDYVYINGKRQLRNKDANKKKKNMTRTENTIEGRRSSLLKHLKNPIVQ